MSRNLMCIVPATLVELEKKGVASHIPQRDLDGYWDTVVTVHPFCSHYSMTSFSKRHVVYEFPARDILKTLWDLPGLARENEISAVKAHDPYWMAVIAMVVARCAGYRSLLEYMQVMNSCGKWREDGPTVL